MLEKFSQVDVTVGDQSFKLFSFKDVYTEFANHLDHGDGYEEPPLYGILWPSAEGLALRLWQDFRSQLAGKRVLEVGAGLGLPSLLAARLGAEVTAMDNHQNFAEVFLHNIEANGVRCDKAVGSFADQQLKLGGFDFIVGSDILYEPDNYPGLERFILRHANPGARVLVADPGRYAADNFAKGWKTTHAFQKLQQEIPSGQVIDIYSFVIG